MTFLVNQTLKLSLGRQFLKVYCPVNHELLTEGLKTAYLSLSLYKQNPDATNKETSKVPKKAKDTPMITLIQDQNITVTALEDAKNLAKRRSMHLVKIEDMDTKTQRPVFKLLTAAEMLQNELSDIKKSEKLANVTKKSEKSLNIGSRIAEHDLSSRIKNICKWLSKQHEVRILIQGASERDVASGEKVFKTIEEAIKIPTTVGKIVQKRVKGNLIRFSILPAAEEAANKKPGNQ